jgi:hypothetical protein
MKAEVKKWQFVADMYTACWRLAVDKSVASSANRQQICSKSHTANLLRIRIMRFELQLIKAFRLPRLPFSSLSVLSFGMQSLSAINLKGTPLNVSPPTFEHYLIIFYKLYLDISSFSSERTSALARPSIVGTYFMEFPDAKSY